MRLLIALSLFAFTPILSAEEKKMDEKPASESKKENSDSSSSAVTKQDLVTIDSKAVEYTVTADKITLKKDDGTKRAEVFYISYTRDKQDDLGKRPVLFAFNGGPGSSAVWLHLGALGPKLVPTSPDGTTAVKPPVTLIDNAYSILDIADLVFIDPVSTGYSRKDKEAKHAEFHGVRGDISSVSDFIRRWTTENKRWNSPKFLLGESYGGIRAAGVSSHLQSNYGMSLNGVVMLSSLLDFRTLRPSEADPITHQVFLPAMAATAHHHGKVKGDRAALIKRAREYAFGDYPVALFKGTDLSQAELEEHSRTLSSLTGVSAKVWQETQLRLGSTRFRRELLRTDDKVLGRFDSRVSWPADNSDSQYPSYDPSYSVVYGAFSTAMLDYLVRDLGYKEDKPYNILTGSVHPWNWGKGNSYVNLTSDLKSALTHNPHLRVLVMCGRTDLATPPDNILYSIRQGLLPSSSLERISTTWYDAGHMFYLNEPDLKKMRVDLVKFIQAGSEQ